MGWTSKPLRGFPAGYGNVGHESMDMKVFVDHYQTEQFGLYWRHFPKIGLNGGLFYNLMMYDNIAMHPDTLFPDECQTGKWGKAYQEFYEMGKIHFAKDPNELDASTNAIFSGKLPNLNVPDFEDVFNYDFCVRNDIPFCLSTYRMQDINRIAEIAKQSLNTPDFQNIEPQGHKKQSAIAKWIVDLEIPSLVSRSEKMRTSPTAYDQLFLSPEELIIIFKDSVQMLQVGKAIPNFSKALASRAELADSLKVHREKVDTKLGKSDFVFSALNVVLCWVPFGGLGTVPAQLAANHYIRTHSNWLLYLSEINKDIRNKNWLKAQQ